MKQIKLTQGQFTIVDDENYKWLNQWKWSAQWNKDTESFYAIRGGKRNKKGKQYRFSMSREILGLVKGDKKQADHVNHNTLDNRELNLRIVTHQQNQWNQKNIKGYSWNKQWGKYLARIRTNKRYIHLGGFSTAKKAHNAYLKAKKLYHEI